MKIVGVGRALPPHRYPQARITAELKEIWRERPALLSRIDDLHAAGFETLVQELRYFKLHHKVDQEHQLWQEGSHPEQILDFDMMMQKVEYIHNNPVRAGYVDELSHWRYSSARNYEELQGIIDVEIDW